MFHDSAKSATISPSLSMESLYHLIESFFLENGEQVLMDIDEHSKDEIIQRVKRICKSE